MINPLDENPTKRTNNTSQDGNNYLVKQVISS